MRVQCHGIDRTPFTCEVSHPDVSGEYCFPPLASLITGAARLMLALLEHTVTEAGGTYAMEDTDSMAIVATKRGGFVPCVGRSHHLSDGREAVHALSWAQVKTITDRFAALNPYDTDAIPGSILEDRKGQFRCERSAAPVVLCCHLGEALRALHAQREGCARTRAGYSEHGLGHLLNPTDLDSEDRELDRPGLDGHRPSSAGSSYREPPLDCAI